MLNDYQGFVFTPKFECIRNAKLVRQFSDTFSYSGFNLCVIASFENEQPKTKGAHLSMILDALPQKRSKMPTSKLKLRFNLILMDCIGNECVNKMDIHTFSETNSEYKWKNAIAWDHLLKPTAKWLGQNDTLTVKLEVFETDQG